MKLSPRLTLPTVMGSALTGLILGIGLAISFRGAPGAASKRPAGSSFPPTITVVLRQRLTEVTHRHPPGATLGDMRIVSGPLYRTGGARRIGRVDLFCVLTDPGAGTPTRVQRTVCTETFTLHGGRIQAQGLHERTALTTHAKPFIDAVIGGTGIYQGVRGQLRGMTQGEVSTFTIHLNR